MSEIYLMRCEEQGTFLRKIKARLFVAWSAICGKSILYRIDMPDDYFVRDSDIVAASCTFSCTTGGIK